MAEVRDREGRTWRCEVAAIVSLAHVPRGREVWDSVQDGLDDDPRSEVAAPWWMVESQAGRRAVERADAMRARLRTTGLLAMGAAVALAFVSWGVPMTWIPIAARGGLGFLLLVLFGLPALMLYLSGTGNLQFGVRMRERRLGAARAERAEKELAQVRGPHGPVAIVTDTLAPGDADALAAVVRRALELPGVERALVLTPIADRQAALAAALGRAVEGVSIAPSGASPPPGEARVR